MRKTIAGIALLLMFTLAACGKTTTPGTNNGGAATGGGGTATANADAIVKQNCTSCHGVNLEGSVGPKLSNIGTKYSKDQIAGIVSSGKGAMPSFKGKLSDADINTVADWLAAKK